jgi:hypothetical protein
VDVSRWQMSDRSPFVRSPTLGPAVSPLPALESRAQQLRGDATEAGGVQQQQQQQISIYLSRDASSPRPRHGRAHAVAVSREHCECA